MRIIIHDLKNTDFLNLKSDDLIIDNVNNENCIGCFNCWVKTEKQCWIEDKLRYNGENILNSNELIIISKCVNGCYSSKVKKILERSISYVHPFFTIRFNELHHKTRTNKQLKFIVYFYETTDDISKYVAKELVLANQKNLNTLNPNIKFVKNLGDIKI